MTKQDVNNIYTEVSKLLAENEFSNKTGDDGLNEALEVIKEILPEDDYKFVVRNINKKFVQHSYHSGVFTVARAVFVVQCYYIEALRDLYVGTVESEG